MKLLTMQFFMSSINSCLLGQTFFSSLCANTTNWFFAWCYKSFYRSIQKKYKFI